MAPRVLLVSLILVMWLVLPAATAQARNPVATQPRACLPEQVPHIPDRGLQLQLRLEIPLPPAYPPITCGDLQALRTLYLRHPQHPVRALEGIQFASGLVALHVGPFPPPPMPMPPPPGGGARITSRADAYQRMYLDHVQDAWTLDIAPLGTLANLERLVLSGIHPTDLTPLTRLGSLDSLVLDYGQVTNLVALRGWRSPPSRLDLSFNELRDIHPLVANAAIGAGTIIRLWFNCLDMAPGTAAERDVAELRARGARVDARYQYLPTAAPCRSGDRGGRGSAGAGGS